MLIKYTDCMALYTGAKRNVHLNNVLLQVVTKYEMRQIYVGKYLSF